METSALPSRMMKKPIPPAPSSITISPSPYSRSRRLPASFLRSLSETPENNGTERSAATSMGMGQPHQPRRAPSSGFGEVPGGDPQPAQQDGQLLLLVLAQRAEPELGGVHRLRGRERDPTPLRGDLGQRRAAVLGMRLAAHQAVGLELVD